MGKENKLKSEMHSDYAFDEKDLLKKVKTVIKERQVRKKYFGNLVLGEPVWDICLDLFYSQLAGRKSSISSACIAAGVPDTTALRYIKQMRSVGILDKCADATGARNFNLELSDTAVNSMKNYLLHEVERHA
jgi:hypothetical protein